ncbi:hypothetical protein R75461_08275 [Paraburkholderia nemoris]|nr:hypothetical protein R75461_08275 [Paraburkholderia nemoris]
MLDALLITLGIAGVSFSLFYKFLLVLYRSGQRSSQHRMEDI